MKTEHIIAVIAIIVSIILALYGYRYYYPQDFSLSIEPMQGQVLQQGVLQTMATVSSVNGYEKTVTLSSKNAVPDVVVSFTPPFGEAKPSYNSNIMISVGKSVSAGTYDMEIKGQGSDGKTHTVSYTLNVISGSSPTPTPTPTLTPTPTSPINVKIQSPTDGETVPVSTIISGTFSGQLPKGQYMWVAINPEKAPGLWWPQGGRITPLNGQWDVQAWMGGDQDKGTRFKVIVISLDENGDQYYLDYLTKGQKTGSYPGIPLPANVNILANISVNRQ